MAAGQSAPLRVTDAYIGLGSNLGDSRQTLRLAVDRLGRLGDVGSVSPLYESDPVGLTDQPVFLNAVALLRTRLEPHELLDGLQAIEHELGRVRTVRWGPRTVDLDLLVYGGRAIDDARLTVPHPRLA